MKFLLSLTLLFSFTVNAQISSTISPGGGNPGGNIYGQPDPQTKGYPQESGGGRNNDDEEYHSDLRDEPPPPPGPFVPPHAFIIKQTMVNLFDRIRIERDSPIDNLGIPSENFDGPRRAIYQVAHLTGNVIQDYLGLQSSNQGNFEEELTIASEIMQAMVDLGSSMTPGVSWARDCYEALKGKDLWTGESLNDFERSVAIVGTVTAGFGSKAIKAINVLQKISEKLTRTTKFLDGKNLLKVFENKSLSEIKETLKFYKKHKFWKQVDGDFVDYITAFKAGTTKVTVLEKDLIVYRYYHPVNGNPKSNWLTPIKSKNPEMELAMPYSPPYEVRSWIIPKGTEVMHGVIAPKWGKLGGGYQYFVPNIEVLKEVMP